MSSVVTPRPLLNPARHVSRTVRPPWRIVLDLLARGRLDHLATVPSNLALRVLLHKYDAITTDAAYDERPSSWLGPLGWWADRRVRQYPIHVALRERLEIVTAALVEAVEEQLAYHDRPPRVLSAPCGLCRDIIQAGSRLRERAPGDAAGVIWEALDIDARGDVLPRARQRAMAAGLPITFHRQDLFAPDSLAARGARYDIVNCIGLTTWIDLAEVERLVRLCRDRLTQPGATLVIDNWAPHEHSAMAEAMDMTAWYHPPADFRAILASAGFAILHETTTSNGACTVTVARAV